jgi:tryptophan synthase beta chain
LLLVNLSGRGDKDVETASAWFGLGRDTAPTDEDERAVEAGRGAEPGPPLGQPTDTTVQDGDAL